MQYCTLQQIPKQFISLKMPFIKLQKTEQQKAQLTQVNYDEQCRKQQLNMEINKNMITITTNEMLRKQSLMSHYKKALPHVFSIFIILTIVIGFMLMWNNMIQNRDLELNTRQQLQITTKETVDKVTVRPKGEKKPNSYSKQTIQKLQQKLKDNRKQCTITKLLQQKVVNNKEKKSQLKKLKKTKQKKQKISNKIVEDYYSEQLKQIINASRFYDIHHFIPDFHSQQQPFQIIFQAKQKAKQDVFRPRKRLTLKNSQQQIKRITSQMTHPKHRPQVIQYWGFQNQTPQQIDTTYFFYQLSQHPYDNNYLQAQYHRYNKLYNIGKYDKQLPLCLVMVGRNTAETVDRTYNLILSQNYTNYRIVHIDDNSIDNTVQKVKKYAQRKPRILDHLTFIKQNYKRNSLYNRNFANTQVCHQDDIIVDLDADDLIIGVQTFQLVNSLYQAGKLHNGLRQQLWCAYFSNIVKHQDVCCPIAWLVGQINPYVLDNQLYRSQGDWRTTQLRTYLRKLYDKIDKNQFVDKHMVKQGQFFVGASDSFMHHPMVEMSNPKHMLVLDQFNYLYMPSPSKAKFVQIYYSMDQAKSLDPYNRLDKLTDTPTRNINFKIKKHQLQQLQKRKQQTITKRAQLKKVIREIYQNNKKQKQAKASQSKIAPKKL